MNRITDTINKKRILTFLHCETYSMSQELPPQNIYRLYYAGLKPHYTQSER